MIDNFRGDYWFLSNFYPSTLYDDSDGIYYPTLEHLFQAKKTPHIWERQWVAGASTPSIAKRRGRELTSFRFDWDDVRISVMRDALEIKFSPGGHLAGKLIATGDEKLVEGNTWGDTFWGVCRGRGENNLGLLLMARRAELIGAE